MTLTARKAKRPTPRAPRIGLRSTSGRGSHLDYLAWVAVEESVAQLRCEFKYLSRLVADPGEEGRPWPFEEISNLEGMQATPEEARSAVICAYWLWDAIDRARAGERPPEVPAIEWLHRLKGLKDTFRDRCAKSKDTATRKYAEGERFRRLSPERRQAEGSARGARARRQQMATPAPTLTQWYEVARQAWRTNPELSIRQVARIVGDRCGGHFETIRKWLATKIADLKPRSG